MPPLSVAALRQRGTATIYSKRRNELRYIGMPAGGIHCGTVYAGGDGRLWLWDIFNRTAEGIDPGNIVQWHGQTVRSRDGSAYLAPAHDIRPLQQGFALRVRQGNKTLLRRIAEDDWEDIQFEATYPIATVRYLDAALPIELQLEAFAPFIPLNEVESNLPATIQSFQIRNVSSEPVDIDLVGWLENAANKFTATAGSGIRLNHMLRGPDHVGIASSFQPRDPAKFAHAPDSGSLCLSFLGEGLAIPRVSSVPVTDDDFERLRTLAPTEESRLDVSRPLLGAVMASRRLAPSETATFDFVIAWHFPNVDVRIGKEVPDALGGHYYTRRFRDAAEVAEHVAGHFNELAAQTRLWKRTWYDSTLPWWFLERTFANISALATTTAHRFASGRAWAWEGVGTCPGNCTHVWSYAQAMARIFPALERDNRQRVDLGISLPDDGGIWFRGEFDKHPSIDGQAGTVLRTYREHLMSEDDAFLRANWPHARRAIEFMLRQARNGDGMEDTPMENTLDAVWKGEIAWIVGLCVAAARAGQCMAEEMGDTVFAARCRRYADFGSANMSAQLFNGEYFIQRPDPVTGRKAFGSYNTCHIDQVLGQSWAFQVGLGRVIDREQTLSALRALWKYNYQEDVGPYLAANGYGRPYALPGEAGMVMNTNAQHQAHPYGTDVTWQVGYFHECMTGFEHQVASHMMAEGMVDESLRLTRAVHDRYHAAKRNPFNEIECSDHYARAMASYGTFLTACGFEYHGPRGVLGFAPRLSPEDFRAPFTAAAGWGTYEQTGSAQCQTHRLQLRQGTLRLREFRLRLLGERTVATVDVRIGSESIPAQVVQDGRDARIVFEQALLMKTGETLAITL